jgi:hypothetical protein
LREVSRITVTATLVLGILSCNGPENELPLSPGSMFTTGAGFLDDAGTVAVKGSIEFQADNRFESGDFSLFMNGRDSLSFLIEGPFKMDVLKIVVLPEGTVLKSRDDAQPLILKQGEKFQVPEYGIEKLSPNLLGVYILPQYYLILAGSSGRFARLTSRTQEAEFRSASAGNGRLVTLTSAESDLVGVYSRAKRVDEGFYPSEIEISDRYGGWRISLEIEKMKIDAELPVKIWLQD